MTPTPIIRKQENVIKLHMLRTFAVRDEIYFCCLISIDFHTCLYHLLLYKQVVIYVYLSRYNIISFWFGEKIAAKVFIRKCISSQYT